MRIVPILITILVHSAVVGPSCTHAAFPEIRQLKKLCLETVLVQKGISAAVIAVPPDGILARQAETVAAAIKERTGCAIAIVSDATAPEELLKTRNVIALGTMADNRFILHLYRQWQVILDLKYPGTGGYVVRSLHNPYGTGRNVIFIGASDHEGIVQAVDVFLQKIGRSTGKTLAVGRLMEIRLGEGMNPPAIGAFMDKWQVFSWNDSRRTTASGREIGYPPASTFGWNPISVAGVLYYMTGKKEYLDCFKALAMPDVRNPPLQNRTDTSFLDPADPLVKNDHYRSHLVDRVFDLIEESPLFTDQERLFITNKLLAHQVEYDPKNTYTAPNGSRHALWHLMNIYTGSRYFAIYYPAPIWEQRIKNVRTSFRSLLGNPTWADRDTLYWVSTSLEPVFEFFLMDGHEDFVKSGTAKTMMDALEVLMSGDEVDDCNRFLSMGLLLRAAHMTGDSRYCWMLRRAGYNLDVFRIGQSYWPPQALKPIPPADLAGRLAVAPLAEKDRVSSGSTVPAGAGFQILSWRAGLEKTDDYLLLDGFEGLGRHPYQVNTLLRLRMFGGKDILSGYDNGLTVWFNGMTGAHVARAAALTGKLAGDDFAYLHTEVPDMPGSIWKRHILALKGEGAIVVDRLIPLETGRFDVVSSWQMGGRMKNPGAPSRRVLSANGAGFCSADIAYSRENDTTVRAQLSRELDASHPLSLATVFFRERNPLTISRLRNGGYLVNGAHAAFVGAGHRADPSLSIAAGFCLLDGKRILLDGATEVTAQGVPVFRSERPVALMWDLDDGSLLVNASGPGVITLGGRVLTVAKGEQAVERVLPSAGLKRSLVAVLAALEREVTEPSPPAGVGPRPPAGWQRSWEVDLGEKITAIEEAYGSRGNGVWVVSQEKQAATLVRISGNGTVLSRLRQPGEILSLRAAGSAGQSRSFGVLAGFRDDTLRAWSDSGQELWSVRVSLHPSFIIGDRYEAPWFTDPRPPYNKTGVYSILVGDLWGTGKEEIAAGRPCTVEFRTLDGRLAGRTPTRWGDTTALALLKKAGKQGKIPLLLAAKAYTGNPQLSAVGTGYQNVSDSLYDGMPPGFTQMHAWLQRGVSALEVADLDGDGSDEVAYTLSGHWNELRVYEGSGAARWVRTFGPDRAGGSFMTALEVADLGGDGRNEVLTGTKMGWLHAFDRRGNLLWQRRFHSGISALAARGKTGRVAVGCEDGALLLLDGAGNILASANLGRAVTKVLNTPRGIVAGSAAGLVRFYPHPH